MNVSSLVVNASTFTCETHPIQSSCSPLLVYGVILPPYWLLVLQSLIMIGLSTGWSMAKPKIQATSPYRAMSACVSACVSRIRWCSYRAMSACVSRIRWYLRKCACVSCIQRAPKCFRSRKALAEMDPSRATRQVCARRHAEPPVQLSEDELATAHLEHLKEHAEAYGVTVVTSSSSLAYLVREGFSAENGIGFLQLQALFNFAHLIL